MALNEVFVPLLQKQFPEIVDFYLPPEGVPTGWRWSPSRSATRPRQAGDAGVWSFLRQFMYTKFVIVCDDDINARTGRT